VTYTQGQAITLMRHNSRDKTYVLFQVLVTARLNVACQDSPSDYLIDGALVVADNFLCHHPLGSGIKANSPEWQYILPTYNELARYNRGLGLAPSCSATTWLQE